MLPLKYYNLEPGGAWSTRHGWNLGSGRDSPNTARYDHSLILLRNAGIIKGIPRRGGRDPFHLKNLWGLWRRKKVSPFYTAEEDYLVRDPKRQPPSGTSANP